MSRVLFCSMELRRVAGLGADAPLLTSIAVVSAAIVFAGNLAANLLYGVVDPRTRGRGEARG